ncbi:MAG: hypothetical protein ABIP34_02715 [Rhodoferax sp.]|uniref:hypothetical protein n=1 Tax=Rhodoferax sp. TaxID=50421 RepID=UPI0032673AE5
MRELFTTLFVFAAAFMLWRAVWPHRNHGYQIAASQALQASDAGDHQPFKWPSLGLFQLGSADSSRYQAALKLVADGTPISPVGTQVVAQLHTGGHDSEIWKPVEIRVHGARVGFLSSGDASRFQRRLAYEGHAGQTTSCDALITFSHSHYDIRLDLKEFRH